MPTKAPSYELVITRKTPSGPLICFGDQFPRDGSCEDTCTGEVCISPADGIVSVVGTASPNFELFARQGVAGRN